MPSRKSRTPSYKAVLHDDDRFISRGELRADLEKHAEMTVKIIRDSMTEVMMLLYMVLGEEAVDGAIRKAQERAEQQNALRERQIEANAQSVAADMQRFDDQNRLRSSVIQ